MSRSPSSICLRRVAIRSDRLLHTPPSGVRMNRSANSSATAATVTTMSNCWRFSIFIVTSLVPMVVEGELHWGVPADLFHLQVAHGAGILQLGQHPEQGRIVLRGPGACDRRQVLDFHRFRR